jgi:hypothetical protein
VDVARAVREDARGAHAHDELRAGVAASGSGSSSTSPAVRRAAARRLEVDEQQPDRGIGEHVAEAAELAVAVVARELELVGPVTRTKPGLPPLYEQSGRPVGVGGGQEEHVPASMKAGPVAEGAAEPLVEPVGQAPGVEAVLQRPHAGVVRGVAHGVILQARSACRMPPYRCSDLARSLAQSCEACLRTSAGSEEPTGHNFIGFAP